ncbi:MAG: hypothetical protein IJZ39_09465 [Oscillospiraceae bacterium]|nr:hypothetical protein [Oscillospiraceae bacterium]
MTHTMQQLRDRESAVFHTIPGMNQLLHARPGEAEDLQAKYPDAAFALRTANELFHHDRELSLITQRAYFSILEGENIASVRRRYNREMEAYVQNHMWDD